MNKPKNYTLLIFDWDGTLVNSEHLAINAIRKIAQEFNYKVPTIEEVKPHFGKNLEGMLEPFFPKNKYALFAKAFYNHFSVEKLASHFFDEALATLKHLKDQGYTLAIATNRPRADLDLALINSNINHLFAATRCPEDAEPKPHPAMIFTLLEELKEHPPEQTLMIGDSVFDMQFAQNANIDAIAACYGHNRKEQLAEFRPVGFINDITELKDFLNNPNK